MYTCCFTGHRDISAEDADTLRTQLEIVLESMYQAGYRRFFCGGAKGFDLLAAESVLQLQLKHEDVRLLMAIPCLNQERSWPNDEQVRYRQICYCADEVRVLAPHYYQGCMLVRNRYMVDRSSFCISFLKVFRGGTLHAVKLAAKKEIPVLNLAVAGQAEHFAATGSV